MSWFLIAKPRTAPLGAKYKEWKPSLRVEGRHQCVYCSVREASFGGYRNFHVEHYRPKSEFVDLTNDYFNLYYACSICNAFKSDVWPGDPLPDLSNEAFPDPSIYNYSDLISVDNNHVASGNNLAAMYTIERLFLNRPQLLVERKVRALEVRMRRLVDRATAYLVAEGDKGELTLALADAVRVLLDMRDVAPYEPGDIRRV